MSNDTGQIKATTSIPYQVVIYKNVIKAFYEYQTS